MGRAETPPPRRSSRDFDADEWTRSPASMPRELLKLKAAAGGSETKAEAMELMGPDTTEKIKKTISLGDESFSSPKLSLGDLTTPNRGNDEEPLSPTLARGKENWQPKAGLWSATPVSKTPGTGRMATVEENADEPWSPVPGVLAGLGGALDCSDLPSFPDDCSPLPKFVVKNTFIQFSSPKAQKSTRAVSTPQSAPPKVGASRLAEFGGVPEFTLPAQPTLHGLQTPCWGEEELAALPQPLLTWEPASLPPLPGQPPSHGTISLASRLGLGGSAAPAAAPLSLELDLPPPPSGPPVLAIAELASHPAPSAAPLTDVSARPASEESAAAANDERQQPQGGRKGDIVRLFDFLEKDLPATAPVLGASHPAPATSVAPATAMAPWLQHGAPPQQPAALPPPTVTADPYAASNPYLQQAPLQPPPLATFPCAQAPPPTLPLMPPHPSADPYYHAQATYPPPPAYGAEYCGHHHGGAGFDAMIWQMQMHQYAQPPPAYPPQMPPTPTTAASMPSFPSSSSLTGGSSPMGSMASVSPMGMQPADFSLFSHQPQPQPWQPMTMPASPSAAVAAPLGPPTMPLAAAAAPFVPRGEAASAASHPAPGTGAASAAAPQQQTPVTWSQLI
eukprot:TRINITY_DN26971_c0_g1_i1.p1 TRINITY_DN26971_c0_g1~~TRINITY_DN26971_c0_g1_i1.p1  ORF type:complete len:642 (-),score=144.76 TRINITY_DN26971_c0_g1_i1:580-2439(-)